MAHSRSRGAASDLWNSDCVPACRDPIRSRAPAHPMGEAPASDWAGPVPRELRGLPRHRQGAVEEGWSQLLPAFQARQNAACQLETEPRLYKGAREIRRRADARVSTDADGIGDRYADRLHRGEVIKARQVGRPVPPLDTLKALV